jgi:phosphatidylinositol alpha-1,6-mannosyltransferase
MRVLYLATDLFLKGGIQRYGRYQVRALREDPKVSEVVVCSLWNGKQEHAFEDDFPVDYAGEGIGIFSKLKFAWRAFTWARSRRVDVIVANHVALAPVAWVIGLVWGIPYALDVYGLELWNGVNLLEAHALTRAAVVIGDCNFILDYVRDHFRMPPSRLALLYDCVDMEVFKPHHPSAGLKQKYGIPEGKPIAMSIGRLVYDKGQLTMIRAIKMLPAELTYVIVGGGSAREAWEAEAIALGVKDRVIFTGRVPEEELVQMYNICDLFVYLSEFKKHEGGGLPLTCIEAAACGKPVLTSNEDGARESVEDGVTGYIVPPRDLERIAARVEDIFADGARRADMGAAAREHVRTHFSYEVFRDASTAILATIQ